MHIDHTAVFQYIWNVFKHKAYMCIYRYACRYIFSYLTWVEVYYIDHDTS